MNVFMQQHVLHACKGWEEYVMILAVDNGRSAGIHCTHDDHERL